MGTTPLRILMLDTSSMQTGWLGCQLGVASDCLATRMALWTQYWAAGPPLESSVGTVGSPFRHRLTAVSGPRTGTSNQTAFAFSPCRRPQQATTLTELRTCSVIRKPSIAVSDRLDQAKWATGTCFALPDILPWTRDSTNRSKCPGKVMHFSFA